MDIEIVTPYELWEGYNPTIEPLQTSVIKTEEFDKNIVCEKTFFTGDIDGEERSRIYCETYYNQLWQDPRSAILILPPLRRKITIDKIISDLVGEGYVVSVIDYNGHYRYGTDNSTFSPAFAKAKLGDVKENLYYITDSVKNTPWFLWAKIARRALTYIQSLPLTNSNKIGVLGLGSGAHLGFILAGIDGRVKGLASVNVSSYVWQKNYPFFNEGNIPISDSDLAFATGIGAETYAKMITCPTFMINSASSGYYNVDRAGKLLSLIPTPNKRLMISTGFGLQISRSAYNSLLEWLREDFEFVNEDFVQPDSSFKIEDKQLKFKVSTNIEPKKIEAYVSYENMPSQLRSWKHFTEFTRLEDNLYELTIPCHIDDEIIIAYANVYYDELHILSTPIIALYPDGELNTATVEENTNKKVVFDSRTSDLKFKAKTQDFFLEDETVTMINGPYSIKGVKTKKGDLVWIREFAVDQILDEGSILHIDIASKIEQNLEIKAVVYPSLTKYTANVYLEGGDFWQKVLLSPDDFKDKNNMSLDSFRGFKSITFIDASNILINNITWL